MVSRRTGSLPSINAVGLKCHECFMPGSIGMRSRTTLASQPIKRTGIGNVANDQAGGLLWMKSSVAHTLRSRG